MKKLGVVFKPTEKDVNIIADAVLHCINHNPPKLAALLIAESFLTYAQNYFEAMQAGKDN